MVTLVLVVVRLTVCAEPVIVTVLLVLFASDVPVGFGTLVTATLPDTEPFTETGTGFSVDAGCGACCPWSPP